MSDEGETIHVTHGKKSLVLRRILRLYGIAFTVLDCAKCKWRVVLEAHHVYGTGKIRPITKAQKKRGYKRPNWDKRCPQCHSNEWHYVRTDVHDHGPASGLYSKLSD